MDFFFLFWISGLIGFSCVSDFQDILWLGVWAIIGLASPRDWLPLQNGRLTRCWGRPHRWQPPSWGRPPPGRWRRGGSDQSPHLRLSNVVLIPVVQLWKLWSFESGDKLWAQSRCPAVVLVQLEVYVGREGQYCIAREVKQSICVKT